MVGEPWDGAATAAGAVQAPLPPPVCPAGPESCRHSHSPRRCPCSPMTPRFPRPHPVCGRAPHGPWPPWSRHTASASVQQPQLAAKGASGFGALGTGSFIFLPPSSRPGTATAVGHPTIAARAPPRHRTHPSHPRAATLHPCGRCGWWVMPGGEGSGLRSGGVSGQLRARAGCPGTPRLPSAARHAWRVSASPPQTGFYAQQQQEEMLFWK